MSATMCRALQSQAPAYTFGDFSSSESDTDGRGGGGAVAASHSGDARGAGARPGVPPMPSASPPAVSRVGSNSSAGSAGPELVSMLRQISETYKAGLISDDQRSTWKRSVLSGDPLPPPALRRQLSDGVARNARARGGALGHGHVHGGEPSLLSSPGRDSIDGGRNGNARKDGTDRRHASRASHPSTEDADILGDLPSVSVFGLPDEWPDVREARAVAAAAAARRAGSSVDDESSETTSESGARAAASYAQAARRVKVPSSPTAPTASVGAAPVPGRVGGMPPPASATTQGPRVVRLPKAPTDKPPRAHTSLDHATVRSSAMASASGNATKQVRRRVSKLVRAKVLSSEYGAVLRCIIEVGSATEFEGVVNDLEAREGIGSADEGDDSSAGAGLLRARKRRPEAVAPLLDAETECFDDRKFCKAVVKFDASVMATARGGSVHARSYDAGDDLWGGSGRRGATGAGDQGDGGGDATRGGGRVATRAEDDAAEYSSKYGNWLRKGVVRPGSIGKLKHKKPVGHGTTAELDALALRVRAGVAVARASGAPLGVADIHASARGSAGPDASAFDGGGAAYGAGAAGFGAGFRRHRSDSDASLSSAASDASSASEMGGPPPPSQTMMLREHFSMSAVTREKLTFLDALRGRTWPLKRPVWLRNSFVPHDPHHFSRITSTMGDGMRRLMSEPNAGGSSVNSEAISMEMLHVSFDADLLHTEMGVKYECACSIADYVASVPLPAHDDGTPTRPIKLGVSVTRAMKYKPGPHAFSTEDARVLLKKKLSGIIDAHTHAVPEHRWDRSLLHVWAQSEWVASVVYDTLLTMPAELWSVCLVLCTVCPNRTLYEHVIFRDSSQLDLPVPYDPERPARERERLRKESQQFWRAMRPDVGRGGGGAYSDS